MSQALAFRQYHSQCFELVCLPLVPPVMTAVCFMVLLRVSEKFAVAGISAYVDTGGFTELCRKRVLQHVFNSVDTIYANNSAIQTTSTHSVTVAGTSASAGVHLEQRRAARRRGLLTKVPGLVSHSTKVSLKLLLLKPPKVLSGIPATQPLLGQTHIQPCAVRVHACMLQQTHVYSNVSYIRHT